MADCVPACWKMPVMVSSVPSPLSSASSSSVRTSSTRRCCKIVVTPELAMRTSSLVTRVMDLRLLRSVGMSAISENPAV